MGSYLRFGVTLRWLAAVPVFLFGLGALPLAAQPTPVGITSVTLPFGGLGQGYRMQLTATGGVAPYQWSIRGGSAAAGASPLPPGLTLSSDGVISGAPSKAGIYPFTVNVFAANQASASADLQIVIVQVETDTPLSNGQTNTAYSQQINVTAGRPVWSAPAGGLAPGLNLLDTGVLSGIPATPGTFRFTALATVANIAVPGQSIPSVTAQKDFQITVTPGPLGILTSSLPDGTVGVAYSQVVRAAGGTQPYIITVGDGQLPQGLTFIGSQLLSGTPSAAGSYGLTFLVKDGAGASASRTLPLNILPSANSGAAIQAQPLSLRFTSFEGGGATAPQNLLVTATAGAPISFAAELAGAPVAPAAWLSLLNPPGATPAQLRLRATPGSLTAGNYQTSVRLSVTGQTPIDIPILFTVLAPAPRLEVAPTVVQASSRTANPRTEVLLLLRNPGGGAAVDYTVRVAGGSRWIANLVSAPARLAPPQPVVIRLTLDISGLKAGAYRDQIVIQSGLGQLIVPVSLFVEDSGPVLDVSARGVYLPVRQGDTPEVQRTIQIRNPGSSGTTVNWTAAIVRGPDLFTLSAAQGSATPASPALLTIGLKANAADALGSKSALLRITDSRAQGSPQYVVLVADVLAAALPSTIQLVPAGLVFISVAGGTAPASQTFQLRTGARLLNFTATASVSSGGNWIRVGAASGSASAGAPAVVNVSVSPGTLGAGVYNGAVTLASDTQVRSAGVTLIVLPSGAKLAAADLKAGGPASVVPRLAEGCTPARVAIAQTALADSFSVPAGWPATLTARLLDDCGTALGAGSVVASFSNGDAPLVLDGDGQGTYNGTWQPGAAAASATVQLVAASAALQTATLEITGGVDANPGGPPSLVVAGLLNNLNPIVGAPLAPGTVTQVYGDNLTSDPAAPTSVPLPVQFKGVEAIIGGFSAPIYYISKRQLTVQVPSELAPNQLHSALLATDAGYSLPVQLPLVPVQPGTVSFPDGALVAQHGDYALVTAANPAKPNEIVTVYLVGMGATTPAVASGAPAPSSPLARVNTNARVTVDGQPAEIVFQGLTPGGVGLYQINFRVPAGAKAGNLDISINQDGAEANTTKLVVGTA